MPSEFEGKRYFFFLGGGAVSFIEPLYTVWLADEDWRRKNAEKNRKYDVTYVNVLSWRNSSHKFQNFVFTAVNSEFLQTSTVLQCLFNSGLPASDTKHN